ncbi:MAG: hypothetical protein ABR958_06420 [Dehalococcoidales bacterium]
MAKSKYAKYIVTDLKAPAFNPEFIARYAKFASRILWMDENVVPGAFQMNCSWYLKPNADHLGESHKHDEGEIIGFFSSDYQKPYDLGAEIEFWLEDEKFMITKSAMIFVPPGMRHCPLILHRVDHPVFHFSVLTGGIYAQKK